MTKGTLTHTTAGSVRVALAELEGLLCFGLQKTHLWTLIGKYLFIHPALLNWESC